MSLQSWCVHRALCKQYKYHCSIHVQYAQAYRFYIVLYSNHVPGVAYGTLGKFHFPTFDGHEIKSILNMCLLSTDGLHVLTDILYKRHFPIHVLRKRIRTLRKCLLSTYVLHGQTFKFCRYLRSNREFHTLLYIACTHRFRNRAAKHHQMWSYKYHI